MLKWYLYALVQYATFRGRATRKEYWSFILINILVAYILSFISFRMGWTTISNDGQTEIAIPTLIYTLLTIMPHISVSVRRIHDINLSGWWGWLFIPLSFPMLIIAFIGTKKEKNNLKRSKAYNNESLELNTTTNPVFIKNEALDSNTLNIDENQFYEQAIDELEANAEIKGLWAKSFAISEGNEVKAKAMYIDLRAKELIQAAIVKEKLRLDIINKENILSEADNEKTAKDLSIKKEQEELKKIEKDRLDQKEEDTQNMLIGYLSMIVIVIVLWVLYKLLW